MTHRPTSSQRLDVLDWMRFASALGVVFYHWTFNGIVNGKITSLEQLPVIAGVSRYGHLGVDVFFLISGYVIAYSAVGKTPREFVVSRAIRLYPSFWVGLTLTTAVTLLWGQVSGLQVYPRQLVANLTMVPEWLGAVPVDGVYWTLALEIAFYGLILVFLFLGLAERLFACIAAWAALMVLVALADSELAHALPLLGGYYPLFAVGALIAAGHRIGHRWWTVSAGFGALALVLVELWRRSHDLAERQPLPHDPIVAIVIILAAVLLMHALGSNPIRSLRLPGAQPVGALTYPLYLLHAHIGYILISLWATPATWPWVYLCIAFLVFSTAWLIHRVVEVRLKAVNRRAAEASVGRMADAVSHALAATTGARLGGLRR